MPIILHLSDLHLGEIDTSQVAGDYKNEIVPLQERANRIGFLRNTLRELDISVRKNNECIDSIVVSGDVAVANAESGFQLFQSVIGELGSSLPSADRIVVVPGNHDVSWKTPPSSPARYTNFIKYMRSAGYITPLLDGIDSVNHGFDFTTHYLRGRDGSYVLIPINSSNYCGSLLTANFATDAFWDRLAAAGIPASDLSEARKEVERLRLHDVARISPQHFENLRRLLLSIDPSGSEALRIAVLHHHLLPVSTSEEFKSFESISNLGLLRNFLRANRFDLVLHGHKHVEHTYWDHVTAYGGDGGNTGREILVVSGATIGGTTFSNRDICRLISIEGIPLAVRIQIRHIPAVESGAGLEKVRTHDISLWKIRQDQEVSPETLVTGSNYGATYARLRSIFDSLQQHTEVPLVVVSLAGPPSAAEVAQHYPDVQGVQAEQKEEWLRDLVSWWQRPESRLGGQLHFTHGSRIYRYRRTIDQIQRVVDALENRDNSGRAIVLLFDPEYDEINTGRRKFPAFTLVQFLIRDSGRSGLMLDCIGYFRKQEIRYWWPVNILELARLQNEVLERVQHYHAGLQAGAVTTVASLAFAGKTPPRVAVPAVDRALDENCDELWSLIYAVFWRQMPNRQEYLRRWADLLDDMIPAEEPEPDGVPVALNGLKFVLDEMRRFAKHHEESELGELVLDLERLYQLNADYANTSAFERPSRSVHISWRRNVVKLVSKMKKFFETMIERDVS